MQILDYVIIGITALCLIVGLVKGLIKQLLSLLGVFAVTVGTAYLFKFPQQWLSGIIPNETWLTVAAIAATLIVLSLVYALIAFIIKKALHSVKLIKVIDKIFGMAVGAVVAYAIIAVVIALFTQTPDTFLPHVHAYMDEQIARSLIVEKIYANNFFGNWVMDILKQGLSTIMPS